MKNTKENNEYFFLYISLESATFETGESSDEIDQKPACAESDVADCAISFSK
tara:strand:- start:399 stop:554 length:156 start_codon:yes stop_codon:yes gene_type:complete